MNAALISISIDSRRVTTPFDKKIDRIFENGGKIYLN